MPNEPQQKDLVEEARKLLAKMSNGTRIKEARLAPLLSESRSLLRQLCDEVEALRKHVADLNHDFDAAMKEADDAEAMMMRKMYGR